MCVLVPLRYFFCSFYSLSITFFHSLKDLFPILSYLYSTTVERLWSPLSVSFAFLTIFTLSLCPWLSLPLCPLCQKWLNSVPMASESLFFSSWMRTGLHFSLCLTLVSGSCCKIVQYGSNARFMILIYKIYLFVVLDHAWEF